MNSRWESWTALIAYKKGIQWTTMEGESCHHQGRAWVKCLDIMSCWLLCCFIVQVHFIYAAISLKGKLKILFFTINVLSSAPEERLLIILLDVTILDKSGLVYWTGKTWNYQKMCHLPRIFLYLVHPFSILLLDMSSSFIYLNM